MHQKTTFLRKRHALVGLIGLTGFLGGMIGGSIIADAAGMEPYICVVHETASAMIAVLIIFALATGLIQYLKPKPRKIMPAMHGLANLFILILFLVQALSGMGILYRAAAAAG